MKLSTVALALLLVAWPARAEERRSSLSEKATERVLGAFGNYTETVLDQRRGNGPGGADWSYNFDDILCSESGICVVSFTIADLDGEWGCETCRIRDVSRAHDLILCCTEQDCDEGCVLQDAVIRQVDECLAQYESGRRSLNSRPPKDCPSSVE
jgi:hypothetical protein